MNTKFFLGLAAACMMTGSTALAASITPTYDTFGTLPGATFGGAGIPNTAVAITTFSFGGDTVTLGLTATPRYPNPTIGSPLVNNGAGTFGTLPGVGLSTGGRSNWNFDYAVLVSGPIPLADLFTFKLAFTNNTSGAAGSFNISPLDLQDSENMTFGFLATPIAYNVNASATYGFALQAYSAADLTGTTPIATSAINVNVSDPVNVPDTASALFLLSLGLAGLLAFHALQNRSAAA